MQIKDKVSHKKHTKESGFLICGVESGSPADKAGIKPGWRLFRIDNLRPNDIIDYKIYESDDLVKLLLQNEKGILKRVKIKKHAGKSLGLSFNPPTMDPMQQCGNRCIFCFIDQNPKGLRKSLYVKDDDYRLSFIYGNFITLNRLTEKEIERIIKLQLSPLYVSVHSTNPLLRSELFGTERAKKGIKNLKALISGGIQIHAQVVLCPGYNTGDELNRTIDELSSMGSKVLSIALVPAGLTDHRQDLVNLRKYTAEQSRLLINEIKSRQQFFLEERNTRLVFLSDEFYNIAGVNFPDLSAYENFPQLENGVGMSRLFLEELKSIAEADLLPLKQNMKVTVVTGAACAKLFNELNMVFSRIKNLDLNIITATNYFFGKSVNTAGLLTGSDILENLKNNNQHGYVFISKSMLKDGSNIFLDNMTIKEIELKLGTKIFSADGPLEMLELIKRLDKNR